jgi:hypothetical protein
MLGLGVFIVLVTLGTVSTVQSLVVDEPCCKIYPHVLAFFGPDLEDATVTGKLVQLEDPLACSPNQYTDLNGSIALIQRGSCHFAAKAMSAQLSNAGGVIIFNNAGDSLMAMSEDQPYPIAIPSIFIGETDGSTLRNRLLSRLPVVVSLNTTGQVNPHGIDPLNSDITRYLFMAISIMWCLILICYIASYIQKCCKVEERVRDFRRLETKTFYRPLSETDTSEGQVEQDTTSGLASSDAHSSAFDIDSCVICLEDFENGDEVKVLPCGHEFHRDCIQPWLLKKSSLCPICKQSFRKSKKKSVVDLESGQGDRESLLERLNPADEEEDSAPDEEDGGREEEVDDAETTTEEVARMPYGRCNYLGSIVAIAMVLTGVLVMIVLVAMEQS